MICEFLGLFLDEPWGKGVQEDKKESKKRLPKHSGHLTRPGC